MNHQEKVDHLIDNLTTQGAWKSNVAPPIFQLFWKLGWKVRPPVFMGFFNVLFPAGLIAGVLWALFMWHTSWSEAGRSLSYAALFGAGFAFGFSWLYSMMMRWMRRKYRLTTWEAYPDA